MEPDRTVKIAAWAEGDVSERSLGREIVIDPTEENVTTALTRLFGVTHAPRVRVEYRSFTRTGPALSVNREDVGVASAMIREWIAMDESPLT